MKGEQRQYFENMKAYLRQAVARVCDTTTVEARQWRGLQGIIQGVSPDLFMDLHRGDTSGTGAPSRLATQTLRAFTRTSTMRMIAREGGAAAG